MSTTLTDRKQPFIRIAQGKGIHMPLSCTGVAGTTPNAGSGFFNMQLMPNSLGTSPATVALPPGLTGPLRATMSVVSASIQPYWLAYFYKMGTVDLTATGDKFTADGAVTYPLTRTRNGVTTTISLIPVIYLTTATATTAPVIRLRTNGGAAGYTNQDGNTVVGARTITFPATATAINSGCVFRLEEGDSSVQSISAVEVTTSGTTGAGTVYGVELIMPLPVPTSALATLTDNLFGGLDVRDIAPATPTAGTLTSILGMYGLNTTGRQVNVILNAVLDTA